MRSNLSQLPPPTANFPVDTNPSYIIPRELMSQLLSSNVRLEKILSDPTSYMLDQIETAIRQLLEDPELPIDAKNRKYSTLLNLQSRVKEGLMGRESLQPFPPYVRAERDLNEAEMMAPTEPAVSAAHAMSPSNSAQAMLPSNQLDARATRLSNVQTSKLSAAERAILINIPAEKRQRAEEVLIELKRYPKSFAQSSLGNLVLDGRTLAGTNFADIISVLFRKTPPNVKTKQDEYWSTRLPRGSLDFLRAFAKTPLGTGLLQNDYLVHKINELRGNPSESAAQLAAYAQLAKGASSTVGASSFQEHYAPIWEAFDDFRDKYHTFKSSTAQGAKTRKT